MARWLAALVCVGALIAANVRLYLKDGTWQVVREYEVKGDRVRYYSVERGDWEEVPVDLVDLRKTQGEQAAREKQRAVALEADRAEAVAEKAMRREIARVPEEPGLYWINGSELTPLKQIESKIVSNKKRSVLKVLSPVPVFSGKATVEVDGVASAREIGGPRPEFYFRLSAQERFGIVRLKPTKTARVVERWTIEPVTKMILQEHDEVEVFRYQVGENLYKVWAQNPMEPGEYAFIQYTEGKGNTQIWDFALRGAATQ